MPVYEYSKVDAGVLAHARLAPKLRSGRNLQCFSSSAPEPTSVRGSGSTPWLPRPRQLHSDRKCRLTHRSSRPAPARPTGRQPALYHVALVGQWHLASTVGSAQTLGRTAPRSCGNLPRTHDLRTNAKQAFSQYQELPGLTGRRSAMLASSPFNAGAFMACQLLSHVRLQSPRRDRTVPSWQDFLHARLSG